jgi:hypothetical protein
MYLQCIFHKDVENQMTMNNDLSCMNADVFHRKNRKIHNYDYLLLFHRNQLLVHIYSKIFPKETNEHTQ